MVSVRWRGVVRCLSIVDLSSVGRDQLAEGRSAVGFSVAEGVHQVVGELDGLVALDLPFGGLGR